MRTKAPETTKPKVAPSVAKPAAPVPAIQSNPLQALAPDPVPAPRVEPEVTVEMADVLVTPAPVVLFGRPEDEIGEPHWVDPLTGFPDTQRRRDGSLFSVPKA